MNMKWTVCSGIVGLALLLVPQQGQALSFTVDSATVNVGETFSINLNVVDASDLTSWQFDLAYDPLILQVTATGVTENAFFTQGDITVFIPGFVDNTAGTILGVSDALTFQSPVSGSGVLATIEFTAVASGTSALTFSNTFLNLFDSFTVPPGSVCVTGGSTCGVAPVPEPSALLLLSLGLGVFLFAQRRQTFGKRGR
jgi:hypothetical protein